MNLPVNKIICGDCIPIMREMPAGTFNMICTSPPYWGLRAYKTQPVIWGGQKDCRHKWEEKMRAGMSGGPSVKQESNKGSWHKPSKYAFCSLCGAWRGELGLEPTPELYIEHLMMVFDECKRVLRPDGICFVNLGDTYGTHTSKRSGQFGTDISHDRNAPFTNKRPDVGLEKSLCAIPERFVLAMMNSGWIRRCTIIWAKGLSFCDTYSGSCMPDSAKDRPNHNGFEYVYMFTKSKKYWYEQQYEEAQELNAERPRMGQGNQTKYRQKRKDLPDGDPRAIARLAYDLPVPANPLGRTIRNVWTINPQAFSEAHFATFPEKLVEPLIKMGCPEFVCKKCGKPRCKIYKTVFHKRPTDDRPETYKNILAEQDGDRSQCIVARQGVGKNEHIETGLTDCGCGEKFVPGIVLDPFAGSCTTALVAYKLRRDYTMIELQPDYVKMGQKRIAHAQEQFGLIEGVK